MQQDQESAKSKFAKWLEGEGDLGDGESSEEDSDVKGEALLLSMS